jgi:hypothetical protein
LLPRVKIGLLHVAKSRLKLSDDDYRSILLSSGGVTSTRDLDERGFEAVMDRFRGLGFVSAARKRGHGQRLGMATPAQLDLILTLWRRAAADPTDAHLNTWLEHFGVSALRFVDATTARKVIGALRAWSARVTGGQNAQA